LKVLVTGNLGYVGSVITENLISQGFEVLGCDVGYFPKEFINSKYKVNTIKKDVRSVTKEDIKECNAIFHLAALSNDPLGELDSSLTNEINFLATIRLAKMAKEIGIERFVFSSSCSIYGASNDIVNEESRMEPLTAYARSKVDSEQELLKLKDDNFSPTILRNATVYGVSPSQRLDLVVNNLVGSAITTNKIHLMSDGTSWRPLLHVEDMAAAFIHILKSSKQKVSGGIFNVGKNEENYKVIEIAEKIKEIIPNTQIEFSKDASKDKRSYKVNFEKIKNELGFIPSWKLDDGIKQVYNALREKQFTEECFKDKTYYRVAYINWLIKNKMIDSSLKFYN
jgi:nucleoside-diphosphate-sugar epimerase